MIRWKKQYPGRYPKSSKLKKLSIYIKNVNTKHYLWTGTTNTPTRTQIKSYIGKKYKNKKSTYGTRLSGCEAYDNQLRRRYKTCVDYPSGNSYRPSSHSCLCCALFSL
mmetsp:Transcript_4659/g.5593  ORF Transcript_4659/g.5593 Transcript_4659/m.5593 type:complete len:108 (-) Transcript_4659:74-397(-)